MKKRFAFLWRMLLCMILLIAAASASADSSEKKNQTTSLVIPNLTTKDISQKTIYRVSNALRKEAFSMDGYVPVDHRDLFKKMKNSETRAELIELSRETGAEKAVIGLLKVRRQVYYLKLELYNLKTDQVEKKSNTAISSLRPTELLIICRGALKTLLATDK